MTPWNVYVSQDILKDLNSRRLRSLSDCIREIITNPKLNTMTDDPTEENVIIKEIRLHGRRLYLTLMDGHYYCDYMYKLYLHPLALPDFAMLDMAAGSGSLLMHKVER